MFRDIPLFYISNYCSLCNVLYGVWLILYVKIRVTMLFIYYLSKKYFNEYFNKTNRLKYLMKANIFANLINEWWLARFSKSLEWWSGWGLLWIFGVSPFSCRRLQFGLNPLVDVMSYDKIRVKLCNNQTIFISTSIKRVINTHSPSLFPPFYFWVLFLHSGPRVSPCLSCRGHLDQSEAVSVLCPTNQEREVSVLWQSWHWPPYLTQQFQVKTLFGLRKCDK